MQTQESTTASVNRPSSSEPHGTSAEVKKGIEQEIGYVLFIDIVGYSKRSIDEERDLIDTLNQLVHSTDEFRTAEAAGKLIKIPTGDGMALVFNNSPESPAECALEISQALKEHPELKLRMGVHSGPVSGFIDMDERANVAGAGINIAQRVMNCGDAGHILLSKHAAEDLAEFERWRPRLHSLATVEVKHGVRIELVNLHDDEIGNPAVPTKLRASKARRWRRHALIATGALIMFGLAVGTLLYRSRTAATSVVSEKSVAVLPFENLSEEKQNAFFADGVQDEILTDLARIADLKVISRTSVMHYKSGVARNLREIGKQLGVANVVEGSVQRSGNRVRVNAKLVDARTDKHLWAQTYDRDLADVFAIQSEIAKTIADQLQAKLSPTEKKAIERPPTSDITAFDLYIRGKNLILRAGSISAMERANTLQGIDLLNQAVARDPSFFDAYVELASAHDSLYNLGWDHTSARLALAEAAIQAAARLRPDAGETHLARARNLYQGYHDYNGALAELELARKTVPNDWRVFIWTGLIQRRQGHWEQCIRNSERAISLDPRNFFTMEQTAQSYKAQRRYTEEKATYDRVLAFEPDDVVTKVERTIVELNSKADTRPLHQMIDSVRAANLAKTQSIADAWLLCALAERDAAAANNALTALGENPVNLASHDTVIFNHPFFEGVVARMIKDDGKAQLAFTAARAEQEKSVQAQPNYALPLCVLGLIDAALGRKEEALREGRRAVELLPPEKDALDGSAIVKYLAMIAAWVGDKDLACEQLAIAVRIPSGLTYGQLKLLPFWDSLRGDLRFEKLVEEAKKPLALK